MSVKPTNLLQGTLDLLILKLKVETEEWTKVVLAMTMP
jgi:hypothetical protein